MIYATQLDCGIADPKNIGAVNLDFTSTNQIAQSPLHFLIVIGKLCY